MKNEGSPSWVGAPDQWTHVCKNHKKDCSIAEVGVYNGASVKIICEAKKDMSLFLFDTFEGLVDLIEEDKLFFEEGQYKASEDIVREYLAKYKNVEICKGVFPVDTGKFILDKKFALVNIDVDTYNSTYDSLCFFADKMIKNGYIIVHDYYAVLAVKDAVDEFLKEFSVEHYTTERVLTQIIIQIKK